MNRPYRKVQRKRTVGDVGFYRMAPLLQTEKDGHKGRPTTVYSSDSSSNNSIIIRL